MIAAGNHDPCAVMFETWAQPATCNTLSDVALDELLSSVPSAGQLPEQQPQSWWGLHPALLAAL